MEFDWPRNLSELKDLDSALKCGICYEFIRTSLIIPNCSHNYCSLCIRRYFTVKQQCPVCSENFFENDLKKNLTLDCVIRLYCSLRPKLLEALNSSEFLKTAAVVNPRKQSCPALVKKPNNDEDVVIVDSIDNNSDDDFNQSPATAKSLSSQKFSLKSPPASCNQVAPPPTTQTSSTSKNSNLIKSPKSSIFENMKKNKLSPNENGIKAVPCPVCSSLVHPININSHLDKCLKNCTGIDSNSNVKNAPTSIKSATTCTITSVKNNISDRCTNEFTGATICNDNNLHKMNSVNGKSEFNNCNSDDDYSIDDNNRPVISKSVNSYGADRKDIHLFLKSLSHPNVPKRKPLTKLVFNVMSDKEIRKKLVEYGLPTIGDRQKLITRLQEYRLLYNAECDSLDPKPVDEIVKEVLKLESCKGSASPVQNINISKTSTAKEIENAQKQYYKKHKSQFAELIEAAKKNWKSKNATSVDNINNTTTTNNNNNNNNNSNNNKDFLSSKVKTLEALETNPPTNIHDDDDHHYVSDGLFDDDDDDFIGYGDIAVTTATITTTSTDIVNDGDVGNSVDNLIGDEDDDGTKMMKARRSLFNANNIDDDDDDEFNCNDMDDDNIHETHNVCKITEGLNIKTEDDDDDDDDDSDLFKPPIYDDAIGQPDQILNINPDCDDVDDDDDDDSYVAINKGKKLVNKIVGDNKESELSCTNVCNKFTNIIAKTNNDDDDGDDNDNDITDNKVDSDAETEDESDIITDNNNILSKTSNDKVVDISNKNVKSGAIGGVVDDFESVPGRLPGISSINVVDESGGRKFIHDDDDGEEEEDAMNSRKVKIRKCLIEDDDANDYDICNKSKSFKQTKTQRHSTRNLKDNSKGNLSKGLAEKVSNISKPSPMKTRRSAVKRKQKSQIDYDDEEDDVEVDGDSDDVTIKSKTNVHAGDKIIKQATKKTNKRSSKRLKSSLKNISLDDIDVNNLED